MSDTHIWLGPGTGTDGKLLRYNKPFDASEHGYLDIEAAVAAGLAKPLSDASDKTERPYTPPPVENFNEPAKRGRKGKK